MINQDDDGGILFKAALNGDVSHIEAARNEKIENGIDSIEEYFLRKTKLEKYNILHIAILYQKNDFIKKVVGGLLPRSVTDKLIYQPDKDSDTPLHVAAEEGNTVFFKLLLEHEEGQEEVKVLKPAASVGSSSSSNLKNKDGNTPLHVALIKRNVDVAKLLVQLYPELACVPNNADDTPLHVAAALSDDASIFEQLLDENKRIQPTWGSKNKQGNTPLHVASINGRFEVAKLLLEQDLMLAKATNNSDETPLHLAIIKHQIIGKKKTEDMMNSETSPISGMELQLQNATKIGDIGFLKDAIGKEIENGNYFLGQDSNGDNILHIAVQFEQKEFIKEVTEKRSLPRSIINKLTSQRNKDGNTPLHVAAMVGNDHIFKMLLQYENGQYDSKNINAKGCTPLHVALINHKLQVVGSCFRLIPTPQRTWT